MATTRNTDRIRFRYGICLNDNCGKCKSKEIQEIPARKDFVCQNPECGKPLRECPPPKKAGNGKLIAIIAAAVVVLGGIGAVVALSGGSKDVPVEEPVATEVASVEEPVATTVASVESDSIKAVQMEAENQRLKDSLAALTAEAEKKKEETPAAKPIENKPSPKPAAAVSTKDLGYATFKGTWPNDVNGRMIFKTSHVIDSRDPKGRIAEAGDYVIGEFADGHLVQGIWYGADNQVKGSVIIGR